MSSALHDLCIEDESGSWQVISDVHKLQSMAEYLPRGTLKVQFYSGHEWPE
jgi:hypothetical protein